MTASFTNDTFQEQRGYGVLVATLGSQPQIITLALDELLARGHPLSEIIVVHLAQRSAHHQAALAQVVAAFADDHYQGVPIRLRTLPILIGPQHVTDLSSEAAVDAASLALHQLLSQLKAQQATVHLCATGGRRLLGMLAIAAALQHFDHHDRVWHLYSSDELRTASHHGAQLHRMVGDRVELLRVPLATMRFVRTDAVAVVAHTPDHERCREVLARLSPRQADVLRALAQGAEPQEVAKALSVEVSTVHAHKTTIFRECINVWGLPTDQRLNFYWLRERFALFFRDSSC
jgi:CRISPR-associated protein Csx14